MWTLWIPSDKSFLDYLQTPGFQFQHSRSACLPCELCVEQQVKHGETIRPSTGHRSDSQHPPWHSFGFYQPMPSYATSHGFRSQITPWFRRQHTPGAVNKSSLGENNQFWKRMGRTARYIWTVSLARRLKEETMACLVTSIAMASWLSSRVIKYLFINMFTTH